MFVRAKTDVSDESAPENAPCRCPNYCENIVTVKHTDPALLQRAKHALLEERLFEEFIPAIRECPQEWLNDPYLKEWWLEEWCNEHWGT